MEKLIGTESDAIFHLLSDFDRIFHFLPLKKAAVIHFFSAARI